MIKNSKKFFSVFTMKKNYKFKGVKAEIFNSVVKDVGNYEQFMTLCSKSEIIKYYNENEFDALLKI